jgi:hypothetical protein
MLTAFTNVTDFPKQKYRFFFEKKGGKEERWTMPKVPPKKKTWSIQPKLKSIKDHA